MKILLLRLHSFRSHDEVVKLLPDEIIDQHSRYFVVNPLLLLRVNIQEIIMSSNKKSDGFLINVAI